MFTLLFDQVIEFIGMRIPRTLQGGWGLAAFSCTASYVWGLDNPKLGPIGTNTGRGFPTPPSLSPPPTRARTIMPTTNLKASPNEAERLLQEERKGRRLLRLKQVTK